MRTLKHSNKKDLAPLRETTKCVREEREKRKFLFAQLTQRDQAPLLKMNKDLHMGVPIDYYRQDF